MAAETAMVGSGGVSVQFVGTWGLHQKLRVMQHTDGGAEAGMLTFSFEDAKRLRKLLNEAAPKRWWIG
jgi:hypothetical protein